MSQFKGKQFQKDVIILAVGYYLRFNLSYRKIEEIFQDRRISVCHTTIQRWDNNMAPSSTKTGRNTTKNPALTGK